MESIPTAAEGHAACPIPFIHCKPRDRRPPNRAPARPKSRRQKGTATPIVTLQTPPRLSPPPRRRLSLAERPDEHRERRRERSVFHPLPTRFIDPIPTFEAFISSALMTGGSLVYRLTVLASQISCWIDFLRITPTQRTEGPAARTGSSTPQPQRSRTRMESYFPNSGTEA